MHGSCPGLGERNEGNEEDDGVHERECWIWSFRDEKVYEFYQWEVLKCLERADRKQAGEQEAQRKYANLEWQSEWARRQGHEHEQ